MNQTNSRNKFLGRVGYRLLILVLIAISFGCSPNTQTAGGGTSGTGISQGTITGFGSIFMNGIEFGTETAKITINGVSVLQSDLRVGMVGTVIGSIDTAASTGVASTVAITYNLVGTVNYINVESRALVVAGQLAIVNPAAEFKNGSLETLTIGDRVAVNGITDTNGTVFTSYVTVIPASEAASTVISGSVNKLDTITSTFRINNLLVNYASAKFVGMMEAGLANDAAIRVTGQPDGQGVLQAEKIESLSLAGLTGNTDGIVTLEGFTTVDPGTGVIKIGNNTISITDATVLINLDTNNLSDKFIRLLGRIIPGATSQAPVTIEADRIEFLGSTKITVVGNVKSVYPPANLVVLSGIPVIVSNSTRMRDVSKKNIEPFTIDDIDVGDQLTVYGLKLGNSVTALVLRRDSTGVLSRQDNNVTLRGTAVIPAQSSTSILVGSFTVDTSLLTDSTGFQNQNLNPISRSEFIDSLSNDTYIEVQGILNSALTLSASKARLLAQSNVTFMNKYYPGGVMSGRNDLMAFWDGSYNTEQDLVNGASVVNMYIAPGPAPLGYRRFSVHDIRVFGPGTYIFDTCSYQVNPIECGILTMTVGTDQVGAHMLVDQFGFHNWSVINVWNKNQRYCADVPSALCNIYSIRADGVDDPNIALINWNLASTDNDHDGFPGVFDIDSWMKGYMAVNFNLNYY